MKPKSNKYQKKVKALKKQLFFGDYQEILAKLLESKESITYDNILALFNNRSLDETKIVKIIKATEDLIESRKADSNIAA